MNRGIARSDRLGSRGGGARRPELASSRCGAMTMRAPQYPKGLRLEAFGSGMVGDVRELNIINHYVGMPPIDPAPALETAVFPIGSPSSSRCACSRRCTGGRAGSRSRRRVAMPIGILVDVQWWLYRFGHSLDPKAPIRLSRSRRSSSGRRRSATSITSSMISWGVVCLFAAAVCSSCWRERSGRRHEPARLSAAPCTGPGAVDRRLLRDRRRRGPAGYRVAQTPALQTRLDAAPRGSTVTVDGGIHRGPIVVRGPLTVVGGERRRDRRRRRGQRGHHRRRRRRLSRLHRSQQWPAGDRGSGGHQGHRQRASHRRQRRARRVLRHPLGDGGGHVVEDNRITPGEQHGARPGHGISAWHVHDSQLRRNHIADARDGIYLSFTDGVVVVRQRDHRLPLWTALDVLAARRLLGQRGDGQPARRRADELGPPGASRATASSSTARARRRMASCSRTSAISSRPATSSPPIASGSTPKACLDRPGREARLEAQRDRRQRSRRWRCRATPR